MLKTGVYVDAANISKSGGFSMRYDVLKEYCSRGYEAVRMNTYISYDADRAEKDSVYREKQDHYHSVVRSFGFKLITKKVKWYTDDDGQKVGKANADLDLAVDMLLQAKNLDLVYLLTGDSDFIRVVQAIQNLGVRVELVAFRNVSIALKHECDSFTSGYIIPNLLPIEGQDNANWMKKGYIARGLCYKLFDNFGFLKVIDSEYNSHELYFPFSEVKGKKNPRLGDIYSFKLSSNDKGLIAENLKEVEQYGST